MSLSDTQWAFLKDLCALVAFAATQGYKLTLGEVWRPVQMQKFYIENNLSETMASQHLKKLAADLNLFINGAYVGTLAPKQQLEAYRPLGEYWKSLHPDNRWGGDWGWDANHFERRG